MMSMATANRNRSGVIAAAALLVLPLAFALLGSARGDIITLTPYSGAVEVYQPGGFPNRYGIFDWPGARGDMALSAQSRYDVFAIPFGVAEFLLPSALTVPNGAVIHSATFSLSIYGAFSALNPTRVSLGINGFADDDGTFTLPDLGKSESSLGYTPGVPNFAPGAGGMHFNVDATSFLRSVASSKASYTGFQLTPFDNIWVRGGSLSLTIDYTPAVAVPEPSPLLLLTCAGVVGSAGLAWRRARRPRGLREDRARD